MTASSITQVGVAVGVALALGYVVYSFRQKRQPELPIAMTCLLTGGGFIIGPVLIYGAFDSAIARQSLKAEHLAIAGLAIIWVSVQFVFSLRVRRPVDSFQAASMNPLPAEPTPSGKHQNTIDESDISRHQPIAHKQNVSAET